jgi:hypothetical protein
MPDMILVLNKPVLDNYLKGPSGDIWRWLERRGNTAMRAAKRQVGVKTGRLRASIHMRHTAFSLGQELWIGSDTVPYGLDHHEGTRPHVIAPKNGGVLIMGRGRIVRGPVMHPGTKPNKFLSSQLWHFRY